MIDHAEIGEFEHEGHPVKLSRTPAFVRGRGPLLREHNHYVDGELLGLTDEEMALLKQQRVIWAFDLGASSTAAACGRCMACRRQPSPCRTI